MLLDRAPWARWCCWQQQGAEPQRRGLRGLGTPRVRTVPARPPCVSVGASPRKRGLSSGSGWALGRRAQQALLPMQSLAARQVSSSPWLASGTQ